MQVNCCHPCAIINKKLPHFLLSSKRLYGMFASPISHMVIVSSHLHGYSNQYDNLLSALYKFAPLTNIRKSFCRNKISVFSRNPLTESIINNPSIKEYVHSPYRNKIEDNEFILYNENGEFCDIFMLCPCGHCEICLNNRRMRWSQRCQLECQSHRDLPLFVTLTYNKYHLPEDKQIHPEHAINFMKHLRVYLHNHFGFDFPIRYLRCSEYGSKRKRPHFHFLIWCDHRIKHESTYDYLEVALWRNAILDSWSHYDFKKRVYIPRGFVYVKRCNNGDAGYYLGKYMSKNMLDISDSVRPSITGSRAGGAIGKPFCLSMRPFALREKADLLNLKYTDRHSKDHKLLNFPFNKWTIDQLLPSFTISIEKEIRDLLNEFDMQKVFHPLLQTLDKFFPHPESKQSAYYNNPPLVQICYAKMYPLIKQSKLFSSALELHNLRISLVNQLPHSDPWSTYHRIVKSNAIERSKPESDNQ